MTRTELVDQLKEMLKHGYCSNCDKFVEETSFNSGTFYCMNCGTDVYDSATLDKMKLIIQNIVHELE